jgi:putative transposase
VHYFHQRYGLVGHLWQGRFQSPGIEAETYLSSCGRYVERNPTEAGLVVQPWDYRWSSCRAYALGEPDPLLADHPWYRELGSTAAARQQRWREFLLGEDPREQEIRRGDWLIGEQGFRGRMHRPQARALPRRRGRPRQPARAKARLFPEFRSSS